MSKSPRFIKLVVERKRKVGEVQEMKTNKHVLSNQIIAKAGFSQRAEN